MSPPHLPPNNVPQLTCQRITYNTRHFSGNYLLVILLLALYAV